MQHIKKLLDGYVAFQEMYFGATQKAQAFQQLVKRGQKPEIMLISCCDSRLDPTVLFNCEPGDLFVVRNVANLVPPYNPDSKHHSTSSALEFAVKHLAVKEIIILGHSHCGGILSLLESQTLVDAEERDKSFIYYWMQIAKEAKEKAYQEMTSQNKEKLACRCAKEALKISIKNLHTFPWIEERVNKGVLGTHAWYFDLETGVLDTSLS